MTKREKLIASLGGELPRHIGIIMDGNGRWAKERGLVRTAGHREGAKVFKKIALFARDIGLEYLTFYAFSTENWKRPKAEVDELMRLLHNFLSDIHKYKDENMKLRVIGDREVLSEEMRESIAVAENICQSNTGTTINIAINYGGRDEITRAAKSLLKRAVNGEIDPESIDEAMLSAALDTGGEPDCDLIIRPSGEFRLSNFLIWQAAYSEYVFMDILWPDFKENDFTFAIMEYQKRSRRFGGI